MKYSQSFILYNSFYEAAQSLKGSSWLDNQVAANQFSKLISIDHLECLWEHN